MPTRRSPVGVTTRNAGPIRRISYNCSRRQPGTTADTSRQEEVNRANLNTSGPWLTRSRLDRQSGVFVNTLQGRMNALLASRRRWPGTAEGDRGRRSSRRDRSRSERPPRNEEPSKELVAMIPGDGRRPLVRNREYASWPRAKGKPRATNSDGAPYRAGRFRGNLASPSWPSFSEQAAGGRGASRPHSCSIGPTRMKTLSRARSREAWHIPSIPRRPRLGGAGSGRSSGRREAWRTARR